MQNAAHSDPEISLRTYRSSAIIRYTMAALQIKDFEMHHGKVNYVDSYS